MKRIISSLTFNMQLSRIPANKVDISVLTEKIQFRNGKEAKNRIMKAPLSEKLYNWNQPDENLRGTLNEAIINLYNKWANGGFGMILTGNIGIDPKYIGEAGQGIISLENICKKEKANFAKLAKTMKSEGSLAVAQINHVGNQALTSYSTQDGQIVQIHKTKPDDPLTFSKDRLYNDIIVRFGHAAKVLFESGFDGMEIHTAHGMLFNQFLSSSNDRKDEYGGGNIDSRSRLLVDTYRHIRQLVKPETGFLIGAKLNSVDFQNSGLNKSDLKQFCNIIEETGFDFVELTGGSMETDSNEQQMRESTTRREDFFIDFVRLASQIFVKTKVYITGNWQTAKGMLNSINTGETDGFGFGRWSCQEPDFPKKLLAGQIFSKPHIKFGSTDYFTAKNASHHQIRQMSEQKGISSNVTDFTREEEADNFKKYVQEYQHHLKTLPGGFNSETGCIVYKPL